MGAGAAFGCASDGERMPHTRGSRLYPAQASILPGQPLTLCVSCAAPAFQIELWRVGSQDQRAFTSDWLEGEAADVAHADQDFRYPRYDLTLPDDLVPGVYIARLFEGDGGERFAVQSEAVISGKAQALFALRRPASEARAILYKLPLSTYHAYNFTGGGSLYHVAKKRHGHAAFDDHHAYRDEHGEQRRARKVTLQRPGGGIGGDIWHQERDPYDPTSARNTFEHWDGPFLRWLERAGIEVDVCMDLDIHQSAELLAPYTLLVSAGHDEYWSEAQRSNVEAFVANGGNLAIFGGNTCWWRVRYDDGDQAMLCDKDGPNEPDKWFHIRPENSLTGVSYRYGGSWWRSKRTALGYTVQHADHWIYEGTSLGEGDVFGADATPPLIGYECDGAPFTRDRKGVALPRSDDPSIGTPADFKILGVAELGNHWPVRNGQGATLGVCTAAGGGTVFNAATIDWPKLLDQDAHVTQITRNVLMRLSQG